MKGKSLRHLTHYVVLMTIMMLGIITFSVFGHSPLYRGLITVLVSLGYFAWGIVHHLLEKNLYPEVVIEYLLFALLGAGGAIALIYYL